MTPAQALRYSDWMLAGRIDRRAETDAGELDDSGALGSAFSFIEESRGGQPLPAELARRLGDDLGVDLSCVRIHTDDRAAQAAAALHAQAFTLGDDIYFAAGAYDPSSEAGTLLIAHEVAHVAQHRRGGAPSGRRVSRPEDSHEQEAESFARRFMGRKTIRVGETDPATLVDRMRREGQRTNLPFLDELEQHFDTSFDFVETYTGKAAELACQALSASAFAVHNIIGLADPSPNRDVLLHELTHIMQLGKRRAPASFDPGSLTVSDPHGAAEVEAARQTGHQEHASPTEIYRTGPNPPGGESADAEKKDQEKRVQYFVDIHSKDPWVIKYPVKEVVDGKEQDVFSFMHPTTDKRYENASKHPWSKEIYRTTLNGNATLGNKSEATYGRDIQFLLKDENAKKHKVTRVSPRTYAFIMDGDWSPTVKDIRPEARVAADPKEQFDAYFEAIKNDKLKPRLKGFSVTYNGVVVTEKTCTYTEPEATLYRQSLVTALSDAYAALKATGGKTSWDIFYDEVMGGKDGKQAFPAKYNGIQGAIFEQLVQKTTGGALLEQRPIFRAEGVLSKNPRLGDDASFTKGGAIIVDGKAAEAGIDLNQAVDYEKITNPDKPIAGYFKGNESVKTIYKAVAYAVPGKDLANKVKGQLERKFPDTKDLWQRFHVSPDPDDLTTFLLNFNPQVRLTTKDNKKSSVTFEDPPVLLPGVKIKKATLNLDSAGGTQVKSGSITMGIDMGGAFKADNIKKPIAPSEGPHGGQVENKFGDFKSKLDKVLGAVTVDAKLTDNGIEASVAMKPGAAKIPQFDVDAAVLTAKYSNEGSLSITGEVGLTHKSGKISGKVKVGWAGGTWSFQGEATLAAGLVEGLQEVTLGVKYEAGKTKIYCAQAGYERSFKAVKLVGNVYDLEYDVDKGTFSGSGALEADFGMFGKAKADATLENNKIKRAELAYESPEIKYPSKSDKPTFSGTVNGAITFENDKFSGKINGTAKLNVPALQKIAGDSGLGLAVDAHINADGSYGGTIKTTTPLKFGKHFEIPKIGCTIKDDGSVDGEFAVKVVNFKYLENAQIDCAITKDGFTVKKADIKVSFGTPNESKFWGALTVAYQEGKGLAITGELSAKIKEGMVAYGKLTYNTETDLVDITLGMDEIKLFEHKTTKSLFKVKKQIPLVSFYNLIGIYLDLGFELSFEFDFDLGIKPEMKLEELDMKTFEYKKISAEIALLGQLAARLIGTPNLGVGIFAISPSVLRGGGGLKMPVVGEAIIKPTGKLNVGYTPGGEVDGDATLGMMMTFGIKASVKPYAELAVLDGVWNPKWEGDNLAEFEILKPRELFNFTVDFGKPQKKEEPKLPEENAAGDPAPPQAARTLPEEKGKEKQAESTPKTTTTEPSESGNDGPFSLSALKPMLEGLPGYGTIKGLLDKAAAAYKKISEFLGRILNAIKGFFSGLVEKIEMILDGFASEGLGFLPKLIKMVLGDTLYDIVEPIINAVAKNAEEIISLFETDPPKGATDVFPWALKLMGKVWNVAWNGIREVAKALWKVMENLAAAATKLATHMVTEGMIGVQRHAYYVWKPIGPNYYFLAATQYKINVLGFTDSHTEEGMITNPKSVVGIVLFEVLEALDVPPTYVGWDDDARDSFRDRWTGGGAGVSLGDSIAAIVERNRAAQVQNKKATDLTEEPQRKAKPGSGVEEVRTRPLKV